MKLKKIILYGLILMGVASFTGCTKKAATDSGTSTEPTTEPGTSTEPTTDPGTSTEPTTDPGTSTEPVAPVVVDKGQINVTKSVGLTESLAVEWDKLSGVSEYNVYVKKSADENYSKVAENLIREYSDYHRVDILGLAKGSYDVKILSIVDGNENSESKTEIKNLAVSEYDRTGFAFSTASPLGGKTVGAYNLDGTLKSNAMVLYVTETNKNTVTMDITTSSKGAVTSCTGVGEITAAYSKGYESKPIDIRIIGAVTQTGLTNGNDKLNLGFKEAYKNVSNYADAGITIEGVGNDATLNGAGVRFLKTKNAEVRNLGLMNWPDDGVALETENTNIWVHNNDVFYGAAGSAADQVKGDGSMDLKNDSQFITISYMHFWDSGKMSLCGMKSETGPNYISYHHNWFDHSDSRHPRIRTMSVHVYNNYYDGNSKYGVGVTTGADAFVEGNYFRNCQNPMLSSLTGTDARGDGTFSGEASGTIKAFNNYVVGASSLIYANGTVGVEGCTEVNASSYDAVLAASREEVIAETFNAGGATYNNFDTTIDLGVSSSQIQTPEAAKETVIKSAGRVEGGDFTWTFTDSEDSNYEVINELKTAVTNYKSKLVSVQGIAATDSSTDSDSTDAGESTDASSSISAAYTKTFDNGIADDYFTIVANLKSGAEAKTYNNVTYTTAIKMESSTSITFTTSQKMTLTIVASLASKNIKIDGAKKATNADGVLIIELEAGSHEITKGDSMNVYALILA